MIGNILLDNNLFIGFGNDDFTNAELTIQIPCDLTIFVLVDVGVRINLRLFQLIFMGLEVNDQVNLQWSSILAITKLKPKIIGKINFLILNFYH